MATTAQLLRFGHEHLFPTHQRPDVVMVRGEGHWLFDSDDRRYLDLSGGLSVNALGHAHPALADAIAAQAHRLGHLSSLFYNDRTNQLAHELCARSFAESVFFANSGAEANEGAIKLARRHFQARGEDRYEVVSAVNSFHGRTLGALAATGQTRYHQGFRPLPEGFVHIPFGDVEALERAVSPRTALVILEPMQGEGGVVLPPRGYLAAARRICDAAGCLLHFDEVQVGMGRTGRWFCHEHDGVVPDSMSLAKALGGGLPLAALLARRDLAAAFVPGSHASTFGGNPISCAAGLAYIRVVEEQGLLERCTAIGDHVLATLRTALGDVPLVAEVRGRGCLIGVELTSAAGILERLRERRVLVSIVRDNVVRLAPPLNIPFEVLDKGLVELVQVLEDAAGARKP
jgi:predicted acetylornithine/succinylornithine family transaminase